MQRRPLASTYAHWSPSRDLTARFTATGTYLGPGLVSLCATALRGCLTAPSDRASSRSDPLGDRVLDQCGQVAVRNRRPHQLLQPLELLLQPGAGSELHLVAPRRERLHRPRAVALARRWLVERADAVARVPDRPPGCFRFGVWVAAVGRARSWSPGTSGVARNAVRTMLLLCDLACGLWRLPDGYRAFRQLPDERRSIAARRELSHELFDLALREEGGAGQDRGRVLVGEVRSQQRDAGEMQPSVAQHLQQRRVSSRGPCDHDAETGFRLRQVQLLDAVVEHRRARLAQEKAPRIDLGDVGDQVGLDPARVAEDRGEPLEQVAVRNGREREGGGEVPGRQWLGGHADNVGQCQSAMGPLGEARRWTGPGCRVLSICRAPLKGA